MLHKDILFTNRNFKELNPRELGEEICHPDFNMGPSSRPFYLLHYIFSGKGVFRMNNRNYEITKGCIPIFHPHEVVYYRTDPDDPWHYCWVGFETSLDMPELNDNYVLHLPQAEYIFRALKDADKIDKGREFYICAKLYEFFSILQHPDASEHSQTFILVKKAQNYIDSNYYKPFTIQQLTKDLNVTGSYFSAAFRRYTGKSPQQYLIDIRLARAAELIVNHGYNINIAAMSSGYPDVFNFSKMFKKKFGVSPSAYLRSKQSENGNQDK